jgi:hypothetical protein
MAQREKIMIAFIAEVGCRASDVVQILQPTPDGGMMWFLRRREDASGDTSRG